ncbi:hypothetical protein HYR69_02275, partial [Candidatus Sumerlaeota bacterium]|nr:hypothetical protein [Candidatus Sumerlaeota bacterium]
AYGDRIRPIHNEIAREAPEIIIVNHTIAALELAHRLGTAPILRIQTPDALSALIPALEKHVDLNRVALVFYQPAAARGFEIKLSGGRVFRAVKMDEGRGEFVLYRLER